VAGDPRAPGAARLREGRSGQDAERVLSLAAVIGRDFDLDLLARATEASEDELLDILDAAASASLVRELSDAPGHYNFAQAFLRPHALSRRRRRSSWDGVSSG